MKKIVETVKAIANSAIARLNPDGSEKLDPTPVEMPLGYHKPPSLAEQIARIVGHHEVQKKLKEAGYESFEEANDFDDPNDTYGDDWDKSPYEEGYEGEFDYEIELEREYFEQKGKERTRKQKKQVENKKPDALAKASAKPSKKAPSDSTELEELD